MMWKETVVALLEISRNLPGGIEESHEEPQTERLVSGP
jgi:hypothetical protein